MRKAVITLTVMVAILYSCTHDRLSPVQGGASSGGNGNNNGNGGTGGNGTTSSDTVCFKTDVLPLYQTYCASTGCHDGTSRGGDDENFALTSYANIIIGIVPFNPGSSKYYRVIQNGSMPPGGSPQLSAAQMVTIAKWINQGALNTTACAVTGTCDTTKTTYSNGISQIFATYCNGCHGVAPGSGNVVLSNYASAKSAGTSLKTAFLNAINYKSATAAMNMPPSGQLSNCQVTQITKWINNGCPQ